MFLRKRKHTEILKEKALGNSFWKRLWKSCKTD